MMCHPVLKFSGHPNFPCCYRVIDGAMSNADSFLIQRLAWLYIYFVEKNPIKNYFEIVFEPFRRLNYRVGHLLADLGWVDLDLESSQAGGPLL